LSSFALIQNSRSAPFFIERFATTSAHFWLGGGGKENPPPSFELLLAVGCRVYGIQNTKNKIEISSLRIFCLRSPLSHNPLPLSFLIFVVSLPLRQKVSTFGSALILFLYRPSKNCTRRMPTIAYAIDVVFAPKPTRAHTKELP